MNLRSARLAAGAFIAALMLCSPAQAQIFRAYVASYGNDANPCSIQQPCRLLPAALAAVADGGEIWMLDSANYNTIQVNITKSVSILAIPGAVGSIVATVSNGILINTAGVKVSLRNLVIRHYTSDLYGIYFVQGAELRVTDCEIADVPQAAIYAAAPGGHVIIRNTVLRNSTYGLLTVSTVVASIDGSQIVGNAFGVAAGNGARVAVSNSVLSGNSNSGAIANASAGGTARLTVERSMVTGNAYGIQALTGGAGDVAEITARNNTVTDNSLAGMIVQEAGSATASIVADGNVIAENPVGIQMGGAGSPIVYTRGNNTLKYNTAGDVSGGVLTALGGQ